MPQKLSIVKSEPLPQAAAAPPSAAFGMTMKPGPEADAIESADVMGGPLVPPVGRLLQTIGGKAVAGAKYYSAAAKAAAVQATPVLKYEAAKTTLEGIGLPSSLAMPIAMVVSGYKRGAKAPATATTSAAPEAAAAARVSPAASIPAVPTSPAVPSASVSAPTRPAGPQWSPQRIRNEVGLAEKRAKVKLTERQREAADGLVAQGQSPAEAVKAVAPPQPARLKLKAEESKEYVRMRKAGKSHQEVAEAIEAQREFARQFGTPSVEDVRKAVASRNTTGRWPSK
jgi:hypothetical protein